MAMKEEGNAETREISNQNQRQLRSALAANID